MNDLKTFCMVAIALLLYITLVAGLWAHYFSEAIQNGSS